VTAAPPRARALEGKVVAITGGARGIGLATANNLHLLGVASATSVNQRPTKRART